MEIFGGNGYVDDGIVARLFREAPVNSIWEGSGNVMCLDVLRAVTREPDAAAALLDDLSCDAGDDARLRIELDSLRRTLASNEPLEAVGRQLAERLVLLAQACLLRRHAPTVVADAFLATRLDPRWGRITGTFGTSGLEVTTLLARVL